ncbi:MAG: uracil-DNA glycosylase [Clostridiales bacterium]|nr:uracil-DNA glycosylase [Clostridiales bacterium]
MTVSWPQLLSEIESCQKCRLRAGCSRTVAGEGSPDARLMMIGEGPGADEDRLGRPFVGRAGQLLTKMIEAIGLTRDQVYICNVVKCRPPQNRAPLPDEAAACLPYLRAQVALVRPRVIAILGATAGRYTIDPNLRITRDRGAWVHRKGVWMMPTYHPSALLRDERHKPEAWTDFKAIRDKLAELNGKE